MFWSIKTDNWNLAATLAADASAETYFDELIISLTAAPVGQWRDFFTSTLKHLPREKFRIALPLITRDHQNETAVIVDRIHELKSFGIRRWLVAQLGQIPLVANDDLASDWNLYSLNSVAIAFLRDTGITRFSSSPEDSAENLTALLAQFSDSLQVIVYQDSPLFIAEPCPRPSNSSEPSCAMCQHRPLLLKNSRGQNFFCCEDQCRTTVIGEKSFCLSEHLTELTAAGMQLARIDFCYREYTLAEAREIIRAVKNGEKLPSTHHGNFQRGWQ